MLPSVQTVLGLGMRVLPNTCVPVSVGECIPSFKSISCYAGDSLQLSLACCIGRVGWLVYVSVVSDSCRPIDCSLAVSSVHAISQARVLEWAAISFSRRSSRHGWNMEIEPGSPALQAVSHITADFLPAEPLEKPCVR